MAKLNIAGYEKIQNLQLGDWMCTIVNQTDELYTFLFDYMPDEAEMQHQDYFNLITIYRNYENPNGFKLVADFNIVRSDGNVEQFPNIREQWIYAHNLITLDKFKEVLRPLLVLNS